MTQKHFINIFYPNRLFLFILISFCSIKIVNSACDALNCPPLRGLCSNNICVCEEGFATVNTKQIKNNGIFCNYKLKSWYVAFILELFFPFGVGHFYSGKTVLAGVKLGIFVGLIISFLILLCVNSKYKLATNTISLIFTILVLLCLLSLILMEIFDLIAYVTGIYSDGNGVPMS